MDYETWMTEAILALSSVKVNQIFLLRDLFKGHRWNSLPKGDRLRFGSYFKKKVGLGQIHGVIYVGKAPNNSAQYKKIGEKQV